MKLISAVAAIVFATATLAGAAPRQGATGRAGTASQAKTVKAVRPASKPPTRKARKAAPAKYRRTTAAQKPMVKAQSRVIKEVVKEDVRNTKHDLKAEEQELKRLRSNLKTAQKAGDLQRVSRDRREIYRLEADVRADRADIQDEGRAARTAKKRSRIPFWGWWRRS
jgi:hypothetical protein